MYNALCQDRLQLIRPGSLNLPLPLRNRQSNEIIPKPVHLEDKYFPTSANGSALNHDLEYVEKNGTYIVPGSCTQPFMTNLKAFHTSMNSSSNISLIV